MKVLDPSPELVWLFVFPHPDDEVAVCTWLKRLSGLGSDVSCVWLHSTPRRREESLAAVKLLDLRSDRLTFWEATDGKMHHEISQLLPQVEELLLKLKPSRIVIPAFEQGHVDHDTAHVLFVVAARRLGLEIPFIEFPLYSPYTKRFPQVNRFAGPEGVENLELSKTEIQLKKRLLKSYSSQTIRRNVRLADTKSKLSGQGSLFSDEQFRWKPDHDYASPISPKVGKSLLWREWLDSISPILR